MELSVIVPIYGVEKFLDSALQSLINQDEKNIEFILINDGSKDNSQQIIDKYKQIDSRIISIYKENSGYGHSVNMGLKIAKGEYVAIFEPDDFVEPNMYSSLLKLAKQFRADIVKSCFYINDEINNKVEKIKWNHDEIPQNQSFTAKDNSIFLFHHPSIWSCIYKKEFLDSNNITFNEIKGSGWVDNPFQVKTMILAKKIIYTKEAYYHWRVYRENELQNEQSRLIIFERSDEIHSWLKENNINDFSILVNLYRRELTYLHMILFKENITKDEFKKIKKMIKRIPRKEFLDSTIVPKHEKSHYVKIRYFPKLYRFAKLLKAKK